MPVIILSKCPICGCSDIRSIPYIGYQCFKCGYTAKPTTPSKGWHYDKVKRYHLTFISFCAILYTIAKINNGGLNYAR